MRTDFFAGRKEKGLIHMDLSPPDILAQGNKGGMS